MHNVAYELAAIAALTMSFVDAASAQTNWNATHSRRAEVNHRLENQDRRIHQEVREGEMSHAEAAKLHRDDHKIRQEPDAVARNEPASMLLVGNALSGGENHLSRPALYPTSVALRLAGGEHDKHE
jgi:hypothetical protein